MKNMKERHKGTAGDTEGKEQKWRQNIIRSSNTLKLLRYIVEETQW